VFPFSRIFVLRLYWGVKVPAADRRALQLILAGPSGISHRAPSSAWSVTPLKIDQRRENFAARLFECSACDYWVHGESLARSSRPPGKSRNHREWVCMKEKNSSKTLRRAFPFTRLPTFASLIRRNRRIVSPRWLHGLCWWRKAQPVNLLSRRSALLFACLDNFLKANLIINRLCTSPR
jgi:hypothetical protein